MKVSECLCVHAHWCTVYHHSTEGTQQRRGEQPEWCYGCLLFSFSQSPRQLEGIKGCDFIKVWNERSVTRRSHTWHPAAGPFFPASSPQSSALMASLWKSVSLIPLRDPSTALSASDTNSIPDRSVRWKPRLSGLLINVATLSAYRQCLSEIHDQGEDGRDCSKMACFPPVFWLKCEF